MKMSYTPFPDFVRMTENVLDHYSKKNKHHKRIRKFQERWIHI